MLPAEAKWFGRVLGEMGSEPIYPMCNIGSSTAEFRERTQSWIDECIFRPAREAGGQVVHLDQKDAPGVDIVGDLADLALLAKLREIRISSVFCSNLLEHVEAPGLLCQQLLEVLPTGGYLFVSVPYRYPYHPDPIDTRFRPSTEELASLFPGTTVRRAESVRCGSYLEALCRDPREGLKMAARLLAPFYRPRKWVEKLGYLPWLFREYEATCLVLQKAA